jgi:hypothetical protein
LLGIVLLVGCSADGTDPGASGCASPPCFDWLGNTFPGADFSHVPSAGHDLAVSGDGVAATGAPWVESAHDVRAYTTSGRAVGPRPASSVGRFREHGGGPRAVEVTRSHVYATNALRLVRWDRAKFMSFPRGGLYRGRTLTVRSGAGELLGVTVCGAEAYAVDPGRAVGRLSPDSTQIKVVNANLTGGVKRRWAVPRARHLSCDRQGNVWVLQQRDPTSSARLARYSPSGSLLGAFEVSGQPMDVAANPTRNEVLIADNGPDQRVERYGYGGSRLGTVGRSYLAGPTPGRLGPRRFAGPRGVDVDAQGNVFVMQSGQPGRGTQGWTDDGEFMIVSKHRPDGAQVWRSGGTVLASVGEPSLDGERFYASSVAYGRGADGRYRLRALTIDPFRAPKDPRVATSEPLGLGTTTTTHVRDLAGRRYLAQVDGRGEWLRLFRLDGLIARHAATFQGGKVAVVGRRVVTPGNLPQSDWYMSRNGDVWRPSQAGPVWRYRLNRVTAAGTPIFRHAKKDRFPAPPGFTDVRRIEVHGDAVYVSGYGPGEFPTGEFDDWKWSGRRMARFNSLPTAYGWPAPVWSRLIHWGPYPGGAGMDRPASWAVDGNRIAIGYQKEPNGPRNYLRILNAADGLELREVHWPARFGQAGWLDVMRALTFTNGWVWVEEGHLGKLTGVTF